MLDGLRGRRTDLLSDIDKARIEVDRLANLRAALVGFQSVYMLMYVYVLSIVLKIDVEYLRQ